MVDLLLKNNGVGDRKPNFGLIFEVCSVLNVDCWVVMGSGRESCLGPPEISSMCFVYCFG